MNFIISLILFTQILNPYETRVFLDADANFLIFARYYQGELIGIDSVKSVSDYFDKGIMDHNRVLLLQELKKDLVQQGGYASKGLFGTFEIPLPKGGFSDFMGETGKLDVGGHVKITLGGSETFISNLPGEARPSLLPELEMKQEMAINLDGQVGDRMRVYIDHNSERVNETQNKITVTYKGREDEVIQEIEGGDTQLSIPATTYTGDVPSHRGLFGLKSSAKLGPLDLVAIASKEQTQTQEIEIEGSIQAQYDTVWAKYYERRRFFWIGTYDSIVDLEVYVDDNDAQNNNQGITRYGNAFLDIDDDNIPDDTTNSTNRCKGYFTLKREGFSDFYRFVPGANVIELNYGLPTSPAPHVLGVWYKKIVNGSIIEVGRLYVNDTIPLDTIQLKLICPEQADTTSYTWNYEKKNYYQIVSPGSRLDSLRIYYITSGNEHQDRQGDVPFIYLLGIDQNQDGLVDENTAFLSGRGLLKFPGSEPFADSSKLNDPDPEIYKNPWMQGQGKYYIYKKTMEAKPVYMLPENVQQVWVYVDDIEQDSIKDYHVDYEEGKLEFKKPILPTQRVRIKVEYAPFFSAAEKSLVGLRGSLRPFGEASLGSSFFYRTESYPAEHVRLREEPFNRMIWEVDFSYPQNLPFLTRLVDWLPLVETEVDSRLNMNFEGAYSFSNLNARGEVFLDDLESSTVISSDVSITRNSWVLCSTPVSMDATNFVTQRLIWFNPHDEERLQADDIYEDPLDPNEIADVIKIIFKPDNTQSFGGLTQYIYSENFEEIENLEVIIKGKNGRLHVDFAQEINEDQLRRNKAGQLVGQNILNDEDKDRNGVFTQQDEDTGLDGVYGDDDSNIAGDDGNDDYQKEDYSGGINGTEQNSTWNTEDIDRNGVLNSENRYYSYSVDLDDTTEFLMKNAGLKDGWKMFRVPIKDSLVWDTVIGQPDWHDIKYVRVWFDNFTNVETLLIYKLSATGSRWKNYGIVEGKQPPAPSEIFTLTPVNTKTHRNYKSPYPVEKDEFGQVKTEGGLEFRLKNILEGHTCVAHRRNDDNEDYRAYDTLTFYLNAHNSNPLISIRVGSDTLNYYEYSTEYENGSVTYNEYRLFRVSMQRFLSLKKQRTTPNDTTTISDSVYTVVGNPSLSKNQFLEVRINNQFTTPLTDTIWFNDVKLTSPRTEIGRIFRSNGSVILADLASLNFSYDESNGRFKRLSESKEISTQSAGRGYAVSSNITLSKFLPTNWGFNIPLGLSYRKSIQEPRFSYIADDIELSGTEREEQKSRTTMKSYNIHASKSNSKNWLLNNTIDRLSFDHDRSQSCAQSVLNADTSRVLNYRGSYTLDPKFDIKLFKQIFSPLPKNISVSAIYADNLVKSYYRTDPDSSFKPSSYGTQHRKTLNPSLSASYSPHPIMNANYTFSQARDSVSRKRRFGEEVGRSQTLNANLARDLKIISPRLSFNSTYNEDYRFEIRQDQNLRNVSNSGRYGVDGTVNVKGIITFFTRLRDETKDSLRITGSPAWFAKHIEKFVGYLQNPSLNWSRQRSSNYLNVKVRPDVKYQWGIVDSIPAKDVSSGSYPGRGMTDMYGVNSGINYNVISANGSYNGIINRNFNYGGEEIRTNTVSYPNLTIRVLRLESLPFLKNWCRSSAITTGYNQSLEERFEINADSTDLISDSRTTSFTPLVSWQSSWKKGISTTLEINYSETNSNDYAGATKVPSKMLNRGGSASLAYTFSAPRGLSLPFLKSVKFASNLSVNLNLSYNRTSNYYSDLVQPTNDVSTLGTNVGFSYNFSSSITGGANVDYSQNKDMNSEQDSRRIGLNVWTNINF
jgi:hypothetical protein